MTHKIFSMTAAAVFAIATSAQAQVAPQFSADVTAMLGRIVMNDVYDPDYSFTNGQSQALSFRLRGNFSENMFGQFDYNTENNVDGSSISDPAGDEYTYKADGAALHLGKTTGDMTIGGMLSLGYNGYEGVAYGTLAAEAEKKTASGKMSGQVGLILSDDGDEQAIYGRVAYVKDINEKTTVTASFGLGIWDYYSDEVQAVYLGNLGLEAQYKISDNTAVVVSYQGNLAVEPHEDETWNSHTLSIGLRLSLGAASKPIFADYNPLYGIQHAKFTDWE